MRTASENNRWRETFARRFVTSDFELSLGPLCESEKRRKNKGNVIVAGEYIHAHAFVGRYADWRMVRIQLGTENVYQGVPDENIINIYMYER